MRTTVLMNLVHAKNLLLTHGYQSFGTYVMNAFSEEHAKSKNKKGLNSFCKALKETPEYKEFVTFQDEHSKASNHPKLRKLVEILSAFFLDPQHAENSKVIVFSQFRNSAQEIKRYLDLKAKDLVKRRHKFLKI